MFRYIKKMMFLAYAKWLYRAQNIGKMARKPGSCKGMLIIHDDDEDHLNDFAKHMP